METKKTDTKRREDLISFLVIEPFVSIILTFGGIWLMWKGFAWMKYVIIVSGTLMNLAYVVMAVLVLIALLKPRQMIKSDQK